MSRLRGLLTIGAELLLIVGAVGATVGMNWLLEILLQNPQ